jgi:hypothetical protein
MITKWTLTLNQIKTLNYTHNLYMPKNLYMASYKCIYKKHLPI